MAFTKVVGAGIHTLSNITSHNINSSGIITATKFVGPFDGTSGTFSGNVTIGGNLSVAQTVTYEDVKNVDSVGVGTFREGVFIPDNKRIRFGNTNASPNFSIYSTPTYKQGIIDYTHSGTGRALRIRATNVQFENWNGLTPTAKFVGGVGAGHVELNYAGSKKFETTSSGVSIGGTTIITPSSGGKLGIGTDNPVAKLQLEHSGLNAELFRTWTTTGSVRREYFLKGPSSGNSNNPYRWCTGNSHSWEVDNVERMRIDHEGRILMGGTTSRDIGFPHKLQLEDNDTNPKGLSIISNRNTIHASHIDFAKSRGTSLGSNTIVQDDDYLGHVNFRGADGSDVSSLSSKISGAVDGTPGSNNIPGRLEFHTQTASGSVTERLRINSAGQLITGGAANPFPTRVLTLQPASGQTNNYVSIIAGNTSSVSGVTFGTSADNNANNYRAMFEYYHSGFAHNEGLRFLSAGTEALRIRGGTAAGDLLYGPGDHHIGASPGLINALGSHHNNNPGSVLFGINDGGGYNGMKVINFDDGTYNSQRIEFLTGKGGYSMATVRMGIDENGLVSIGRTVSANSSFNQSVRQLVVGNGVGSQGMVVYTGASHAGSLIFNDVADGTFQGGISYKHGSGAADNSLKFYANADERLRITKDGNAVLGTTTINTAQDKAFSIFGTNGSELKLQATNFGGTAADGGAALTCTFGSLFLTNNNTNGDIHFMTKKSGESTTEKMRITESGRVGINSTAPEFEMDVLPPTSVTNNTLCVKGRGSGYAQLRLEGEGGASENYLTSSTTPLAIYVGSGGQKAKLDTNGMLLLGAGGADTHLHIKQTTQSTYIKNETTHASSTYTGINLRTPTLNFQIWNQGPGATSYGGANSVNFWQAAATGPYAFFHGNTERLRIKSDGNVTISNTTTSPSGDFRMLTLIARSDKQASIGFAQASGVYSGSTVTGGYTVRLAGDGALELATHNSNIIALKATQTGNVEMVGDLSTNNLSGRNIVINGDMRVAQRATSASMSNHGNHIPVCDRWNYNRNGVTATIAQVAEVPDASGFKYSLKWTSTSAVSSLHPGNALFFAYAIERQDIQRLGYGHSNGKKATLSFYAKGSLAGKIGMSCTRDGRIFSANVDMTANTWQRHSIVIPADTSTAFQASDNASGFYFRFCWGAGSNSTSGATNSWINFHNAYTGGMTANQQGAYLTTNGSTFQITGVQLEIGSQATPFEFINYDNQLKMCQRYYAIFHPTTQSQIYIESGGTNTHSFWQAPVPPGMRTEPSVNLLGTWTGHSMAGGKTISAVALQGIDNGGNQGTAHPGSMGRASFRVTRNSGGTYSDRDVVHHDGWGNGNAWIGYDAEL